MCFVTSFVTKASVFAVSCIVKNQQLPCNRIRRRSDWVAVRYDSAFYNFLRITVAIYLTEFESIIVYRSTRRACCFSENIRVREFSAVTFVWG